MPNADGSRTLMYLVTIPASMHGDDVATLEWKLRAQADVLIAGIAAEARRMLDAPDVSPEALLATAAAEAQRIERAATAERLRSLGITRDPA